MVPGPFFDEMDSGTIARVGAFFSLFRNLHAVRSFAPLETQVFAKKRFFFLQIVLFIAVNPDFMTIFFLQNIEFRVVQRNAQRVDFEKC